LGLKVKSLEDEEGEFLDNMLAHENVKNKVAKLYAKNGNALIELIDSRSYANKKDRDFFTIGASHFAFTVDDLEKTYDYLVKNGVKFTAPPQQTPDRFAKVTFCEDPDGTLIELVEVINTD
jgi:catechol 2,3-dioxygenase-like lactoylglutathione lyase family enzyme